MDVSTQHADMLAQIVKRNMTVLEGWLSVQGPGLLAGSCLRTAGSGAEAARESESASPLPPARPPRSSAGDVRSRPSSSTCIHVGARQLSVIAMKCCCLVCEMLAQLVLDAKGPTKARSYRQLTIYKDPGGQHAIRACWDSCMSIPGSRGIKMLPEAHDTMACGPLPALARLIMMAAWKAVCVHVIMPVW